MNEDDGKRPEEEYVSKSQRKREMHALQKLGRELTELSERELEKLPLPDSLLTAIEDYKRLPNKHEARRRQMQYIGRLMREVDTEGINEILYQSRQQGDIERRKQHKLEGLRDQLLDGDQDAMNRLIADHPEIDIQHVRQLIRQARKERKEERPPAAARKLFRYLRETLFEE